MRLCYHIVKSGFTVCNAYDKTDRRVTKEQVGAHMTARSLSISEDQGSNPLISKLFVEKTIKLGKRVQEWPNDRDNK